MIAVLEECSAMLSGSLTPQQPAGALGQLEQPGFMDLPDSGVDFGVVHESPSYLVRGRIA
jgi:hypothetical protein